MIHPESRTLAWIETVANENNIRDIALVEKQSGPSPCWKPLSAQDVRSCSRAALLSCSISTAAGDSR